MYLRPLPQGQGTFLPIFARAWRDITLRHYRAWLWKSKWHCVLAGKSGGYLVRNSRRHSVDDHRDRFLSETLEKTSQVRNTLLGRTSPRRVDCDRRFEFRAVSSTRGVRERDALRRYLDAVEAADSEEEVVIEHGAVAAALAKLRQHPEPEARFMCTNNGNAPVYNVQTAVAAEHALIVVQKVTDEATDNRSLQPMAEAAHQALGEPSHVAEEREFGSNLARFGFLAT